MATIDIGERIRMYRKKAGLSQDQLAELSLLNRVTIAKYESGRVEPGAQALSRIADAIGISVDELMGRTVSQDHGQQDDELMEYLDELRRSPDMRMLFSTARNVKPEHIRAAVAMLKSFEPEEFSE